MELSYEIVGPPGAPEIVLIHGITESRHAWRPIIDRLSERYRVLAVDLRGHGESPPGDAYDPLSYASDVVETIQAVSFRSPLLVGHSLGGVVATAVASLAPSRGVINVDQPLRLAGFKAGLTQLQPLLAGTVDEFEQAMGMVITVPYLSIHGIDPGPGYADWLTDMVPSAVFEFWDDLGHYPHLIESDRLCAHIDTFC